MIERIGATRPGMQQNPDEPAVPLSAPPHVMKKHRLMQSFTLEHSLHHFHGNDVTLICFGGGDDGVSV